MTEEKLIPGKLYEPKKDQETNVSFHKETDEYRYSTCDIKDYPFVLYLGPKHNKEEGRMEYWFLSGDGEKLALWNEFLLPICFKRIG